SLLDELERLGLDRDTLVVVTADHGEEFLEHGGLYHGRSLYEEVIRVPLILRLPGRVAAGERRDALVRQVDILPTILAELGIAPRPGLSGRPLLVAGGSDGAGERGAREALSHTRLFGAEVAAVSSARWKVVHRLLGAPRGDQVFDLLEDPGEKRS